jgi:hypothetical protein
MGCRESAVTRRHAGSLSRSETCSTRSRWILAFWIPLILFAGSACAQADTVKRVLLISAGSRLAPGYVLVDQQILAALQRIPATQIQVYGENLDMLHFREDRYQQIFRDYLAEKYLEHPPDLVVLVFVGRLGIPGKVLSELFPKTPKILAGFVEEELTPDQLGGSFGASCNGRIRRLRSK